MNQPNFEVLFVHSLNVENQNLVTSLREDNRSLYYYRELFIKAVYIKAREINRLLIDCNWEVKAE